MIHHVREPRSRDPIVLVTRQLPEVGRPAVGERALNRLLRRTREEGSHWSPEDPDQADCWQGSHPAVTRSLLMGLEALGCRTRFNPGLVEHRRPRVGCLSGPHLAGALLVQRASGVLDRLVIGPNTHVSPLECGPVESLLRADAILCPSPWVVELQQQLAGDVPLPLRVWAAGTDTDFWSPTRPAGERRRLLLYVKTESTSLVEETLEVLQAMGRDVITMIYGHHRREAYREALDQCAEVVYLGGSESQGLALQEAWSMDCPTYVYSPGSAVVRFPSDRPPIHLAPGQFSPAPYLTHHCGELWSTGEELAYRLNVAQVEVLRPREWVLANMTLILAARRYLALLDEA